MLRKLSLVLFLLNLGSISAQNFLPELSATLTDPKKLQVEDTVRILGVMVNFQEDKDASTFGNGKFGSIYSRDYGTSILDPLPHDKSYFEAHLEFVKNYYKKVSGDRLLIEYYIFPDTFSVSKTMRNYSPPINANDFTPLGDFAREVWTIADSLYPRFDFSNFDIFSIFHAGVGRDISLPGSLGNERDLPSVYLGLNTLKNIYGENFEGFSLVNNSFKVPNTMIIPETESRELSSFGSTFLFEITINGLIAANVASYLGLPDLFDTNTGLSAIGRFGLMDGQSIFAYNGVFPPEPSAWEKLYMGWAEAVVLEPGEYNINLITKIAATLSDTVILKIPINDVEYYLVENRIRDARNDGAVLTYIINGDTNTRTFLKDTTGFYSYSVDSVDGVVIDVDEFDWAIPGDGLVIWHIDESVIQNKLAENKINTDKFNRGVDVEEADGIQDIGERFLTIFGDEIIGEGTADDFWYQNNPSNLYKNKFDRNSRPDTKTNRGANSLITMDNFSEIANRMSFRVIFGDSVIKPVFAVKLDNLNGTNNSFTVSEQAGVPDFAIVSDSTLYLLNDSGLVEAIIPDFSIYKPVVYTSGGNKYLIGTSTSEFTIYRESSPLLTPVQIDGIITAPPIIRHKPTEEFELLIGTSSGKVFIYNLSALPDSLPLMDSIIINGNYSVKHLATDGFYISGVAENNNPTEVDKYILFDNTNITTALQTADLLDYALTIKKDGNYASILLFANNLFSIFVNGTHNSSFSAPGDPVEKFSVADVRQDGENYILISAGKIYVMNLNGVLADNFPFEDPANVGFEGIPLAADFEGDGKSEVIAYTLDGRIFAIDGGSGRVVNGFPLSSGNNLITVPVLFNYGDRTSLAVVNAGSNVYGWIIGSIPGKHFWAEENADNMNSSFMRSAASGSYINEFFPQSRAYNYPNPVYDGRTYIRYYLSENSKVNIKIFDLAGDFVAELNDDAVGGADNETIWEVHNVQSGIYFARVEASSETGRSESTIIKIAVVK